MAANVVATAHTRAAAHEAESLAHARQPAARHALVPACEVNSGGS